MNDVNKNLGHATAYGYAKSKGYTGTEEEFAVLMADYAAVGERAEAAATAAAASATAASGSASDSATSATAAAGSSTAASTAAGNASQAAQTATTKASEAAQSATAAAGSATTASTKAGEAAQSATQAAGSATAAESAKTAAQTAQTAAETAQTAAETAQTAAEDAAESISASAAQIAQNTADISSVKNALGATLITDTASGAIATFTDGSDGVPMESVTVQMEPIQDLHGQDAPYPGGGGKNQYIGSPSFDTYLQLVSWTKQTEVYNGHEVYKRSAAWNGLYKPVYLPVGTYTFSCSVKTNDSATVTLYYSKDSLTNPATLNILLSYANTTTSWTKISGTFNVTEAGYVACRVERSTAGDIYISEYQLESGSIATTFAPYSNICPISGRSEVGVWRSGVNVWDEEWENGVYNTSTGQPTSDSACIRSKNRISAKPNTSYYGNNTYMRVLFYDANDEYISYAFTNTAFTTPQNCAYMRFYCASGYGATYNHDISINYPSTDHDYHASDIASITVQLGQTVYGGTVDAVSGVMTVNRAMVQLDGRAQWTKSSSYPGGFFTWNSAFAFVYGFRYKENTPFLCSHAKTVNTISQYASGTCFCDTSLNIRIMGENATLEDWTAYQTAQYNAGTPIEVCCELETPVSVQLTAQQLTTLLGVNNVWSDGGNVSVEYVADTKAYIAKVIAAALA